MNRAGLSFFSDCWLPFRSFFDSGSFVTYICFVRLYLAAGELSARLGVGASGEFLGRQGCGREKKLGPAR